ncbi:hypothetical protein GcM3_085008 [Golovinomyces cichoracearum]|uniref:Essential protein Yae1 N-terminal domain-containing protein n=1 Tax=Golovinomyces cichoracearum TaxID=62708 RepID=A0A420ILD2_9PEZI|nr:hypothetical protein GcM3_085008 [Golovinomyces cichoracearum]
MRDHPFDEVLNLEQDYYDEGYRQGFADGKVAGQSEGRTLGLEKGFEKFRETGRLHGKSLIWANQLLLPPKILNHSSEEVAQDCRNDSSINSTTASSLLKPLSKSKRVTRHLIALHALVESETLSIQNTEEAVSDFDERLKKASIKSKLIESLIENNNLKSDTNETSPVISESLYDSKMQMKIESSSP